MKTYSKYKRSGWFQESHRHSLAAKGVKTGRKSYSNSVYGLFSKAKNSGAKQFDINSHNYAISYLGNGKFKLSLGNMTDAGWFWDGNEDDLNGYLVRLQSSQVRDEFLKDIQQEITFEQMKPFLEKSIKKGDGLYEISGDNVRWHFGDNDESDIEIIREDVDEMIRNGELSEKDKDDFTEKVYSNEEGVKFEDFEKENKSVFIKKCEAALKESKSYSDYMNTLEDFKSDYDESYQNMKYEDVAVAIDKTKKEFVSSDPELEAKKKIQESRRTSFSKKT